MLNADTDGFVVLQRVAGTQDQFAAGALGGMPGEAPICAPAAAASHRLTTMTCTSISFRTSGRFERSRSPQAP